MTKTERIHTEYNQKLSLPCCLRRLGLFGAPLDRQPVTAWWPKDVLHPNQQQSALSGAKLPSNLPQLPSKVPEQAKKFSNSPQMAWGGELFSPDIMWWLGDWIRPILHQLPLPRKSQKRGKHILVSTSLWEVSNHIRWNPI